MVILRATPGLANAMIEYAVGYALAMELNEKLIIDLAEYTGSVNCWLLDQFQLSFHGKLLYDVEPAGRRHLDTTQVPMSQFTDPVLIVDHEDEVGYCLKYIKDDYLKKFSQSRDKYLTGYFSGVSLSGKYWEQIKGDFKLTRQYEEIAAFEKLIINKISVGIHVRRGDMLVQEWAVSMPDNYYRAAISWMRRREPGCIFCVFSDDKEYTKKMLGNQNDIYYIDWPGTGGEADLFEFVCLTKCSHRILSNSSSFGSLADILNGNLGRYTIRKCVTRQLSLKDIVHQVRYRYLKESYDRESKTKEIKLSPGDIKKYSRLYKKQTGRLERQDKLNKLFQITIIKENAKQVLEEIGEVCIDAYCITNEIRLQLTVLKMKALFLECDYNRFLGLARNIYTRYCKDTAFRQNYIYALEQLGYTKEAALERKFFSEENSYDSRCFVIMGHEDKAIYTAWSDLMQLAEILAHLGKRVLYVSDDTGEKSGKYIEEMEFKNYRDKFGIEKGYIFCSKKQFIVRGVESVIKKSFPEINSVEICIIVQSENELYYGKDKKIFAVNPIKYKNDVVQILDRNMSLGGNWHRFDERMIERAYQILDYFK